MRRAAVCFAFALVLAAAGPMLAEDKEFKGSVTDDMCGATHTMEGMDAKECTNECVKMGSAYALHVPAGDKVYLVDAPEKLKPFAGEKVVVKGSLSADGKTIHITSVTKDASSS